MVTYTGHHPCMDLSRMSFLASTKKTSSCSADQPSALVKRAKLSPDKPFPRFSYVHTPSTQDVQSACRSLRVRVEHAADLPSSLYFGSFGQGFDGHL